MLTGCFKNLTLFKKISNFFQKSLDFSIFLYYNQLTSGHEFQQRMGQSRGNSKSKYYQIQNREQIKFGIW